METGEFYRNVFDAIAPAYDRLRVYPEAGRRLAAVADLRSGDRVCDVAAGTGAVTLPALQLVGPAGRIAVVDLSAGMLAQAQEVVGEPDGVTYHVAPADRLPFADGVFDCVTCGLGLPFFPDVGAAVAEAARVLRPGGRYAVSVFAGEPLDPALPTFVARLRTLLAPVEPLPAENRQLGEGGRLAALLAAHAFTPVREVTESYAIRFPDFEAWWETAIASPPGAELSRLGPAARRAFEAEHRAELAPLLRSGALTCTVGVRLVLAQRPAGA